MTYSAFPTTSQLEQNYTTGSWIDSSAYLNTNYTCCDYATLVRNETSCTLNGETTLDQLVRENVYVNKKVNSDTGKLYQQYTGTTSSVTILNDNYFNSIFPGMLTLFQMLIGARESSLVELLLPNMPCW